jgi:tetratricopeptide (TPR) repeat protein
MGAKNRYLILLIFFLFLHSAINAQKTLNFRYVDTLSYDYYKRGEWSKLISLGEAAIDNNIDYKYLRQRIGYAFFVQGDYHNAINHFEKALLFDSFDEFSLEYLYYSYLNTGKDIYSGVFESRLSPELKKSLSLKPFKILESFELEYDYKYATAALRSNPQYYRFGINTRLGYRFSLSQAYSGYNEVITGVQNGNKIKNRYNQPEYFVRLNYDVSNHMILKIVYHYLHSSSATSSANGNLFLVSVAEDLNRYSFELNGSVLKIGQDFTYQAGMHAGYTFPGRSDFYLNGFLSGIFQQNDRRVVYNQKAGLKVMKTMWLEGNITFGRLNGYNDYDGLYVYNSYDPMTFRSGITMFLSVNRNIMLWGNFSYEQKEYYGSSSNHYNQFSYLGGIKWKL